jgi:nitrite reductase (cytochrome c-552)
VAAANALGFHAPVEALRVRGTSIQKGEQARRELAALFVKQGWKYPVELPDISTKEKAQKFIGLDMSKLTKTKEEVLKTTTVKWDEEARQRQGYLFDYKTKDE